jgi:hypothetical protein
MYGSIHADYPALAQTQIVFPATFATACCRTIAKITGGFSAWIAR